MSKKNWTKGHIKFEATSVFRSRWIVNLWVRLYGILRGMLRRLNQKIETHEQTWLPVMYFSCSLLTKNNMISLAICVINTCKLSKDYKFHLPYGLVIFCCLWKIYSCLLTPSSLEIIFLPILIAWLHWWGEARMNFFSSRRSRGLIKRVILSSYSVRHFVLTMPFSLLWCLNCILS